MRPPVPEVESLLWEVREDAKRVMAEAAFRAGLDIGSPPEQEVENIMFFRSCAVEVQRQAYMRLQDLSIRNSAVDFHDSCMLVHVIIKQAATLQAREGYSFNEAPKHGSAT